MEREFGVEFGMAVCLPPDARQTGARSQNTHRYMTAALRHSHSFASIHTADLVRTFSHLKRFRPSLLFLFAK